jgi:hypothetical protein
MTIINSDELEGVIAKVLRGFLQALRWHPDQWAKFPDVVDPAVAVGIDRSLYTVTTVTQPDEDRVQLFVKYNGEAPEGPTPWGGLQPDDFQNPPAPPVDRTKMQNIIKAARCYPGQWFIVRDMHTAAASLITHGKAYGAEPNEFRSATYI